MSDELNRLCTRFKLADQDLGKEISDLHLDEIAQTRNINWKLLPSRLELQKVVANDIDKTSKNELDKRLEFFRKWKGMKGSEATYRSLVRALLDIKQRDNAEYVCKLLQQAFDGAPGTDLSPTTPRDPHPQQGNESEDGFHHMEAEDLGLLSLSTAGDLTQYFPYLQESSTLTKERMSMFKENLYRETNRLKFKFASLMLKVQKDLENKRLPEKEIVNILVFYDKNFAGVFHECTDFSSIFRKLRDFVSFFDYDLLEQLIDEFGSDAIKTEVDKYKGYFQEFAKRRVIECPSNAFADYDSRSPEKVLVLVADKNIEDLSLDELKKFKCRINEIMGNNKLVRVLRVKGGSICIAFQIFEDRNFMISEIQQQALQREGVISITYGDCRYDIRTASPEWDPEITIVLTGERGAGKSTLMNNLLGMDSATKMSPQITTKKFIDQSITHNGTKIRVIDIHCLASDKIKELKRLSSYTNEKPGILLYCVPVDPGSKFGDANHDNMRCLTRALGKQIWDHCVLVFTMSNLALGTFKKPNQDIDPESYQKYLDRYAERFEGELHHPNIKVNKKVKTVFRMDTKDAIIAVPVGLSPNDEVVPGVQLHPGLASQIRNNDGPGWMDVLFAAITYKSPAEFQESLLKYRYGKGLGGSGGAARGAFVGWVAGGPIGIPVVGASAGAIAGTLGGAFGVSKLLENAERKKIDKEVYEIQHKSKK